MQNYHEERINNKTKFKVVTLTSPSVFKVYDKVRRAAIFMDGLASGD